MSVIRINQYFFCPSDVNKSSACVSRCCTSCPPAVSGALTSSGAPGTPRCCRLQASTDTSISTPSWEAATRRRARDTPTRWAQISWERRKETRLIYHLLCLTWLSLQISTSFGNMDPFGTGQTLPPLQLPQTTAPRATVTPLKKPPKWIRRPVGASFAVSAVHLVFMTLRIERLCFIIWNLPLALFSLVGSWYLWRTWSRTLSSPLLTSFTSARSLQKQPSCSARSSCRRLWAPEASWISARKRSTWLQMSLKRLCGPSWRLERIAF